MTKHILFIILAVILFATSTFAAEVKNVKVQQAGSRVLFEFDVIGDLSPNASVGDEGAAEVNITITVSGKTYTAAQLHFEGDYGKVKVGNGKKIYWNVLQDFPRGLSTTFDWEIKTGGDLTVVLDNTNLMWTKDGNIAGKSMNWYDSFKFIEALNKQKYAGYSDWRLPLRNELETLINYAKGKGVGANLYYLFNKIGFKNMQAGYYWSSTSSVYNTNRTYVVDMSTGCVFSYGNNEIIYVLPVRAGQ